MSTIAARNALNASVCACLAVGMDYRFTGNAVHEVCCTILAALMIGHNALNRRWYGTIAELRGPLSRKLRSGINLLLASVLLVATVTGVLISRTLFAAISVSGHLWVHQLHTVSSYSGFVLCGIHAGLHGKALLTRTCRWLGIDRERVPYVLASRVASWLVFVVGLRASFAHDVGSKLLLRDTYASWGARREPAFAFLDYCAILGCYLVSTHLLLKLLPKRERVVVREQLR